MRQGGGVSAPVKGVDVHTLAKLFGVVPRRIQQLAKDGVIPKAAHGLYPLLPAIKGYIGFLQQAQRGSTPSNVAAELAQLRLARARLSLQRDEMEFAHDAAQLVLVDEAVTAVATVVEATRTVLQLVPREYGHDAEDRARLKQICQAALSACIDKAQRSMAVLTGEADAMPDAELDEAARLEAEALDAESDDDGEGLDEDP